MPSPYYSDTMKAEILAGNHRDLIGGLWKEVGQLQLDFLKKQGLQPHHKLMDIGCGSLRLGCLAVDYLEPRHYFGVDLSEELIDAGYNKELTDRQRERLPRSQLHATDSFDFRFLKDWRMDIAVAQSVFTHLPLNHFRDCLMKLAPVMQPAGVLYATFFLCPDHHPLHEPVTHPVSEASQVGVTTHAITDPYHYRLEDLHYITNETPWQFQFIGDWGHPRNQQMAAFILHHD